MVCHGWLDYFSEYFIHFCFQEFLRLWFKEHCNPYEDEVSFTGGSSFSSFYVHLSRDIYHCMLI